MRELNHPNIVKIYEFFDDTPNYYYLVLELMKGGKLFDHIEFYDEDAARNVCSTLLKVMKHMHGLGVVNRDLKPESFLLASPGDDSRICLADVGCAVSILDGPVSEPCGTPGYMAPEILRNQPYTTTVDMWSIGVIFHIILAGYQPFANHDQNRLYRSIKLGHFRFQRKCWNDVSSEAK
ncbi:unnamed protein product, partial [Hapterophycus canaliculatus]